MKINLHIMAKAAAAALTKQSGAFDKLKGHATPQNALTYGLPAAFGGMAGAEQLPGNRMLGALGGAAGAVAGSELGGRVGRAAGKKTPVGESVGELLGRLMGGGIGQSLGIRGARLVQNEPSGRGAYTGAP